MGFFISASGLFDEMFSALGLSRMECRVEEPRSRMASFVPAQPGGWLVSVCAVPPGAEVFGGSARYGDTGYRTDFAGPFCCGIHRGPNASPAIPADLSRGAW